MTSMNMETMHIVIDLAKCVGCYNCLLACKDEHVGNSWGSYTQEQQKHDQEWIRHEKIERGRAPFTELCFVTKLCQHCKNAPCEKAAPDAVIRRPDGAVLLDVDKAKGNKALVGACPYGSITWNDELQTAQKCTLCAHLLDDGWAEPRCVQACPLRALSVVRCGDDEFETLVKEQQLEPLTDGSNAPRVLYRNLYRRDTCFIAGALAYRGIGEGGQGGEGGQDCPEKAATEASVRLVKDECTIAEMQADFLGEFKIDCLPKNSGVYELICTLDGYEPIKRDIIIGESSPCLEVMIFD